MTSEFNSPPVHEYGLDLARTIQDRQREADGMGGSITYVHTHQPEEPCVPPACTVGEHTQHPRAGVTFGYPERGGNLGEVIDRRVQVYGDPVAGFACIAAMWTEYLDFPVQAHQVPMMMLLMKVVRSKTSPDYSDHSDDIEGYLDIFRKIIGEDMIQARSVNEYIEKKWPNG